MTYIPMLRRVLAAGEYFQPKPDALTDTRVCAMVGGMGIPADAWMISLQDHVMHRIWGQDIAWFWAMVAQAALHTMASRLSFADDEEGAEYDRWAALEQEMIRWYDLSR